MLHHATSRERHHSGISFQTNLTFTVPMSPSKRKAESHHSSTSSAADFHKNDSLDSGVESISHTPTPSTPAGFRAVSPAGAGPFSSHSQQASPLLLVPPPAGLTSDPSPTVRRVPAVQRDSPVIVRNPDVPLPSKFTEKPLESRGGSPRMGKAGSKEHLSGKGQLQMPVPINVGRTLPSSQPSVVSVPEQAPPVFSVSSPFQPVAFHPSPAALLPLLVPGEYTSHPTPKKDIIMGRPGTGKLWGLLDSLWFCLRVSSLLPLCVSFTFPIFPGPKVNSVKPKLLSLSGSRARCGGLYDNSPQTICHGQLTAAQELH